MLPGLTCSMYTQYWVEAQKYSPTMVQNLRTLGTEKLIHSPPYRPQSSRRIEGFHCYLKACIVKHMHTGLEWDEVTAMATAAYNHFPNMSAKESAFFLMYGRDPVNKLSVILNAPITLVMLLDSLTLKH